MVNINDSVISPDGALKMTLTGFDPRRGEGQVKIEELQAQRGRFYVTVEYGEAGQTMVRQPPFRQFFLPQPAQCQSLSPQTLPTHSGCFSHRRFRLISAPAAAERLPPRQSMHTTSPI
jgi:hypothetical protein